MLPHLRPVSFGRRAKGSCWIGTGMTIVRDLAHRPDGASYVGYLCPLWHEKRQTFADMVMHTHVLDADERPLPAGYVGS